MPHGDGGTPGGAGNADSNANPSAGSSANPSASSSAGAARDFLDRLGRVHAGVRADAEDLLGRILLTCEQMLGDRLHASRGRPTRSARPRRRAPS